MFSAAPALGAPALGAPAAGGFGFGAPAPAPAAPSKPAPGAAYNCVVPGASAPRQVTLVNVKAGSSAADGETYVVVDDTGAAHSLKAAPGAAHPLSPLPAAAAPAANQVAGAPSRWR